MLQKLEDLFADLSDAEHFVEAPASSWIAITDILGSTRAIQEGRYKDVNTVGAASIIALLNACKRESLPFVFGGDGAAVIIPSQHLEAARQALLGCKDMARSAFGFELRCGLIPVSEVLRFQKPLKIARYEVAPGVGLPIFRGGALKLADALLKGPDGNRFEVKPAPSSPTPQANFSGLECRWKPIPSKRGLIINLIVDFLEPCPSSEARMILEQIAQAAHWRPGKPSLDRSQLRLAITPRELRSESRVLGFRQGNWVIALRAFGLAMLSLTVGRAVYALMPSRPLPLSWLTDWKHYFTGVRYQVDDRKFDDVFRAVIDASPQDWTLLETHLLQARDRGWIRYGSHVSTEMLMTCMVFDRDLQHLHFVDGARGGYAMAARQLKSTRTEAS